MMEPFKEPVYVTRPFLPPLSEFSMRLTEIWDNKWLTNDGPVKQRLEEALARLHKTTNICLFNNGTQALQIALQGMNITGEAITTPFTFVATAHTLYWNKIRPVFCDIEPKYYTIDPDKIENLITPQTSAIVAVHVYGFPCHLEKLKHIAQKHELYLIYDAAHAFGVNIGGKSIADFGDVSMFSFHATKLYHSFEGGMLVFKNERLKDTFNYLKNFGFNNFGEVVMPGTNAKMSEIHAAMGLLLLDYIDDIIVKQKKLTDCYREMLTEIPGVSIYPELPAEVDYNYSYLPVEIHEDEFGMSRDRLYEALIKYNVFSRPYFYPLVTEYDCYRSVPLGDSLDVAISVSQRILALPMYSDLKVDEVYKICEIIKHIHAERF